MRVGHESKIHDMNIANRVFINCDDHENMPDFVIRF